MSPSPFATTPNTFSPLFQRDTWGDAKTTLSSWDNCMSKAYCKWPVIVAIILASLILLSILISIFRCLCCGLECCFGCLSCCNACCPSPRRRRSKYEQAPQQPPQQWYPPPMQPYGPQHQMSYMSGANKGFEPAPTVASYDKSPSAQPEAPPPSYVPDRIKSPVSSTAGTATRAAAVSRKAPSSVVSPVTTVNSGPDALPVMPEWTDAQERRIEQPLYTGTIPEEPEKEAIAMGAIGRKGSSPGARGVVRDDDEQRMPMLNTSVHDEHEHEQQYGAGAAYAYAHDNPHRQGSNDSDYYAANTFSYSQSPQDPLATAYDRRTMSPPHPTATPSSVYTAASRRPTPAHGPGSGSNYSNTSMYRSDSQGTQSTVRPPPSYHSYNPYSSPQSSQSYGSYGNPYANTYASPVNDDPSVANGLRHYPTTSSSYTTRYAPSQEPPVPRVPEAYRGAPDAEEGYANTVTSPSAGSRFYAHQGWR